MLSEIIFDRNKSNIILWTWQRRTKTQKLEEEKKYVVSFKVLIKSLKLITSFAYIHMNVRIALQNQYIETFL